MRESKPTAHSGAADGLRAEVPPTTDVKRLLIFMTTTAAVGWSLLFYLAWKVASTT